MRQSGSPRHADLGGQLATGPPQTKRDTSFPGLAPPGLRPGSPPCRTTDDSASCPTAQKSPNRSVQYAASGRAGGDIQIPLPPPGRKRVPGPSGPPVAPQGRERVRGTALVDAAKTLRRPRGSEIRRAKRWEIPGARIRQDQRETRVGK